jgi:hypothetical protein
MVRRIFLALFLALIAFSAIAQDDAPPVITADNVRDLAPARTIRFDDLEPFPNGDAAIPLSGWFTLSPDGEQLAFVIDGGIRVLTTTGAAPSGWVLDEATVIDARWDDASARLATVHQQGDGYVLSVSSHADGLDTLDLQVEGVPVRVWFDAEVDHFVWLELTPAPEDPDRSGFQVIRVDLDDPDAEALTLPTGPEHDFDSFVRIGRIPAPLAITATFAGTARRWDLQTGEVTAEVEMPVAPTFGRVNETNGVDFAWRDEMSTALHLLNFETGEDREIAPLDGAYIQALIPSPDASVILAVHRGERPDVTAWIVETGEEIALGDYDTSICSRVPDMVQLARNGTRLVIGCEEGFQVWEVSG